jgi:hypothetical protein
MEVWIMGSYNRKQWNKRHSISIGVLTRKESQLGINVGIALFLKTIAPSHHPLVGTPKHP